MVGSFGRWRKGHDVVLTVFPFLSFLLSLTMFREYSGLCAQRTAEAEDLPCLRDLSGEAHSVPFVIDHVVHIPIGTLWHKARPKSIY